MKKKKESDISGLVTMAGFWGLVLLNIHKPFFLYEQISKIKNIPLWSIPEMNLQSYYSPTKEKPIPVYADGEVVASMVWADE